MEPEMISAEILGARVRNYAIQKLAGQLYSCVECLDDPRDKTDWRTAEEFFNERPYLVDTLVDLLTGNLKNSKDFYLPREELTRRVRRAIGDDGYLDSLLGRWVWDYGYQILKRYLIRPPYGKILHP